MTFEEQMNKFDEKFPNLGIHSRTELDLGETSIDINMSQLQKDCLDKQRVKEAFESLQQTIGRRGINIALYDLISEKMKDLGWDK